MLFTSEPFEELVALIKEFLEAIVRGNVGFWKPFRRPCRIRWQNF